MASSDVDTDSDWRSDHFAPGIVPDDYKPQLDEEQLRQSTSDIIQEPPPLATGRIPNTLLSRATSEPTFLEDANAQPGVCGLRNLGNTCYMNAGIQSLLSVPRLTQYFNSSCLSSSEQWPSFTDCVVGCEELDKLLVQVDSLLFHVYSKLSRSVWSGKYSYLTPTNFKAFLGEAFHPFRGYKAHDCQEFMGVFLDHMNAVLKSGRQQTFSNLDDSVSSEPSKKSARLEDSPETANHPTQNGDGLTVVEETFMGRFSTKVTCLECRHETLLEEPFFFLSVPLPRGFERQFRITWCPLVPIPLEEDCTAPDGSLISVTECLVTVFKNQNVSDLKTALLRTLGLDLTPDGVALVEVSGSSPHRVLQDALIVSYIKDDFRSVYAVEMKVTPTSSLDRVAASSLSGDTETTVSKPLVPSINGVVSSTSGEDIPDASSAPRQPEAGDSKVMEGQPVNPASLSYHVCAICLEEIQDTDLIVHPACGCTLCETCLSMNCSRVTESGDTPCPVCSEAITIDSFIPYPQLQTYQPETKRISMFVIFRYKATLDTTDGDKRHHKNHPFSHPCLMEVDNHLKGYQLYSWVAELPRPSIFQMNQYFQLSLTDDLQDTRQVPPDFSDVIVRPSDRLFVDFGAVPDSAIEAAGNKVQHSSLLEERREPLTLWNCLDAFSQSEVLGPENMWYCPMCQDSKSVEKFIRIKELPSTLIIHLKRFAFHGSQGDKIDAPVRFPFSTDFSSYVFPSDSSQTHRPARSVPEYDLISCVCHFGGLHGGHYTAYTKHPVSQEWVYYNDHKAELKNPEDQTDTDKEAYILIYQKRGESLSRIEASTELEEREEERKIVQLIVERIQREEAAKVVYGPAPAPVTGPTQNPFMKDTYMIDFEEFGEDYYPDNPSFVGVATDGIDASVAGGSKETDGIPSPSEGIPSSSHTSKVNSLGATTADSVDSSGGSSAKINSAITDNNLEFQWDHIM